MTYRRDPGSATYPTKLTKTSDETSVESGSFHSGLSNEIVTDCDSDMFDSDGDILTQISAQADESEANKDRQNQWRSQRGPEILGWWETEDH